MFTSPTKRVHKNPDPLEPHTWYLRQHGFGVMYRVRIQLSTRIRTLLRFTFANYWPVQLPVSMLKWNPRDCYFAAFVNVFVAISSTHEHNGQACLYVVSTTRLFVRWTNPKSSLRIQKKSRFRRFRLELRDSTIWIWLRLVLKWLTVVVKIAAEGREAHDVFLLKSKWVGNTFMVARKCGLLTNCRAE